MKSTIFFSEIFSDLYDVALSKKETEIKSKHLNTSRITKEGLRKSSERKHRFYEKKLKIQSKENKKKLTKNI